MFKQAFNIVSTTVRGHIGAYGLPFVQDKPTEYGLGYSLVAKYAYDSFTSPYGTVRRNRKVSFRSDTVTSRQKQMSSTSLVPLNLMETTNIEINPVDFSFFLDYFNYLD